MMKTIPKEFRKHWRVFSEELSKWFPSNHNPNMIIKFLPNAPISVKCKPYPRSKAEGEIEAGWIKQEKALGCIEEGALQYVSPIFLIGKKDSSKKRVLQSITMPTKNIFPTLSFTPAHSSYPFLYTTCKRPPSSYSTGMSLNCNPPTLNLSSDLSTSMSLNCTSLNPSPKPLTCILLNCINPSSKPSSSTMLNCKLAQTMLDMPSSHNRHLSHLRLLSYWTYNNMLSSHLRHFSHLSYLGTIGSLNCHCRCSEPLDCNN
jgi:hypothetical protein